MTKTCKFCNFKDDYLVIKDYKYWTLFLLESQSIIGWISAFLKRHIEFFEELKDEELTELKQIIKEIKSALNKTFHPDWFNVMHLGNMVKHLHIHLVPRYKEARKYDGRTFVDKNYGRMVIDRWKPENKKFLTKVVRDIQKNMFNL